MRQRRRRRRRKEGGVHLLGSGPEREADRKKRKSTYKKDAPEKGTKRKR